MNRTKSFILGILLSLIAGIIIGVLIRGTIGIVFGAMLTFGLFVIWTVLVYVISNKIYKSNPELRYVVPELICGLIAMYALVLVFADGEQYIRIPLPIHIAIFMSFVLGLFGAFYFWFKSEIKKTADNKEETE